MKTARLAVLGIALAAGGGAAYVMMGIKPPEPVQIAAPPPPPSDAVLVAAHDLNFGSVITPDDVRWQSWPKDQVPPGTVARSQLPNGLQTTVGQTVRVGFLAGEPLRLERLGKGSTLSAVLPPGMRAVAIDLTDQGKSAAGGFILPNDRVDVIRTFHPDNTPLGNMTSETILTNIRVLAIGQAVQEKAGERIAMGGTATLELSPAQAEKVILAQRTGQLTLSLRSTTDAADAAPEISDPLSMTIIRSGNASQTRVK